MAVKKRQKALASGRPPVSRPREKMTSERSRSIIRLHHTLQKDHAAALKRGDEMTARKISRSIEKNGGIKLYQAASKQGQAKDRGGDSSRVLVDWLQDLQILTSKDRNIKLEPGSDSPLQCLEIGALSTDNEISKYPKKVSMTRIDLNSQGPGIEKQDFMERPLPTSDEERFDIISLSLVLNYVPDPVGRGEMLKRLTKFLRPIKEHDSANPAKASASLLFFVLPLPCVENSRYFDEKLLLQIMGNLGFTMQKGKNTSKLCYYLFAWDGEVHSNKFSKKKIQDKPDMNNFRIVME